MNWRSGAFKSLVALLVCDAFCMAKLLELKLGDDYSFGDYVRDFNRVYTTDQEFAYREKVFRANMREIQQHNSAGGHSYRKGINLFADRTKDEFRASVLGYKRGKDHYLLRERRRGNVTTMAAAAAPSTSTGRPSVVDWREKGALTDVKNQGSCGSCWTFGSTEALESELFLETGRLLTFSEQAYVSCTDNPGHCGGTGGCQGGTIDLVFSSAMDMGIFLEQDIPYTASDDGKCILKGGGNNSSSGGVSPEPVALLEGFVDLPENDLEATLTAVAERPVPVNLDASAFAFYSSGVFDETHCGTDINHVVLLVGFTEKYLIIRNSWGPDWGEGGYMRINLSSACAMDSQPRDGTGCDGGPPEVKVCGSCGIAYQNAYPKGLKLTSRGRALLYPEEAATSTM